MNTSDVLMCEELLQKYGYRVTRGRVSLLMFLKQSKKPLAAKEIQKGMRSQLNKVTLYRALEDFTRSKIVGKINLQNTSTYYEFLHKDHHHHHIVCENCGKIEDIEHCEQTSFQNKILKSSKNFSSINSHSLEFFGICKTCAKK